ncbi:MAG TPA: MFS transporter [Actinomycetales bacterium]|nr:MFS transporter [Actinomycetales bacterium]
MTSRRTTSFPLTTVAVAASVTAIANLPVFLLGAMAPAIRAELRYSAAGTGLAVSAFFAASALSAPLMARLIQRAGPFLALRVAASSTCAAMVLVAVAAQTWLTLTLVLVGAGVANAVGQTSANLTLAELASPGHDGIAFGIKQGAVPLATMVAGLAVPLVASTVGWRWGFAMGAVLAVPIAVVAPRLLLRKAGQGTRSASTAGRVSGPVDWLVVSLVAAGAFLASGVSLGLAVYVVELAIHRGWTADQAGTLLAVSSVCTVAVRVFAGWWMDVRDHRGRRPVPLLSAAGLIAAGAVGCLLLAVGGSSRVTVAVGTILGMSLGWGWAGLMHLTIVQLNRTAAATATGLILFGVFGGGVVLPSATGMVVEHVSYSAALLISAGGLVLASFALFAAHRVVVARALMAQPDVATDAG